MKERILAKMSAMDSTRITLKNGQLHIPNNPIIHYIEGDGIGIDITPVMIDVAVSYTHQTLPTKRIV